MPNIDWNDPNLRYIDLDGDGRADLLITEDHALVWYRSRAKQGFEESKRVPMSFDERDGPLVVFSDPEQSIQLADMSGDGLVDIVRVRNGEVCYWPNLGYGRFGAKVTLGNGPTFDTPDHFHASRVRFGDVDGSGTSDLFYLGRRGVTLYLNESGNALSDAVPIRSVPPVDSAAQVSIADLLGTGTSCLVWSTPLQHPAKTLFYVDLMDSKKPHLLTEVKNNLGATTTITYASSTKYYLEDKKAGVRWLTRLPFPVQVVERMERNDAISGGKLVSRYRYRHGYYDGAEREFRGFARVDQWDAEDFAEEGTDPLLYQPPVHTISWYHTGAWLEKTRLEIALQEEYFDLGPPELLLEDTILPGNLSVQDEREAARALKGSMLRQEVYGEDGSEKAGLPFVVTEQNQEVRLIQRARGEDRYGIFFAFPRETVTITAERKVTDPETPKIEDPRVGHEFILDVDEFGNVTRQAAVAYARAHAELTAQGRAGHTSP